MKRNDATYQSYLRLLSDELVPAMGCTEPIAVAYAAATCRDLLEDAPTRCLLVVSGPIIKNVKSVIVPNTGGRKGMEAAVAAGILGGDAAAQLEVLAGITQAQKDEMPSFLREFPIEIIPAENGIPFFIDLTLYSGSHCAQVVIEDMHTNIVSMARDGKVVLERQAQREAGDANRPALTMDEIWSFIHEVDIGDIADVIGRFIEYNWAISQEGLTGAWGARIGRIMLETQPVGVQCRARAAAAAGSDARMSGCEMPVVIVSGSGNQGITASIPVIVYAKELGSSEEALCRAVTLSALTAIHLKSGIGRISAFCGAVCAGVGAGCGIAYLQGADLDTIKHTVVNALGILPGMICDGAKPSCAAKIAAAVDAGIMGYHMYAQGEQFYDGDGIIKKGVENTIGVIGELADKGMRQTDRCILDIMVRPKA